jgi:CRP-like cAMP-binding protein
MIQETPQTALFKQQLYNSLLKEALSYRIMKVAKGANIYSFEDKDDMVYFIESGQVKLLMLSPEGKECILAIHSSGSIFGELCLAGLSNRVETAKAMENTFLRKIPCDKFFAFLRKELLLDGFIKYLAIRIANQQQAIANLVTTDSEQRLAQTLLELAQSLGKKDSYSTIIKHKISHEELSKMIGTTRPRISIFMQKFRNLGLIETTKEHFMLIKQQKLANYLSQNEVFSNKTI